VNGDRRGRLGEAAGAFFFADGRVRDGSGRRHGQWSDVSRGIHGDLPLGLRRRALLLVAVLSADGV
jgi:hypothetical protein